MRNLIAIIEGAYDDEPDQPHGSFGWWVYPDGTVEEVDEAGNHGWMADQYLTAHFPRLDQDYDEALSQLIEMGGVRVATFHGSDSMGIDLPPKLQPSVRESLLGLLRETRGDFVQYYSGHDVTHPFSYQEITALIRSAP